MIIRCTKNLLDYAGVKPQSSDAKVDPLFSWTANLILLNRRKTLVAVNSATQCSFMLYGLTTKSIAKLPELVMQGIRALLQSEYVAPEVIEKNLDDLGRDLIFDRTASRSDTAYCNKACERVKNFADLFDSDSMFQERFLPLINDHQNTGNDHYSLICDDLIDALTNRYGSPVQSAHVAELEVTLDLLTPCSRTLVVPSNLNFHQLHRILQCAFEWHDNHLHQFVLAEDARGRPIKVIQPDDEEDDDWFESGEGPENIDGTTITVKETFEQQSSIRYDYDFGDGWVHTIKLKRFIPDCTDPYPHCTKAVGDAPIEDCGGPCVFDKIMKILDDPTHPEHKEISGLVRDSWWQHLDIMEINRRIRQEHRICVPIQYYY